MKFSFEQKKEIYKRHCEGYGSEILSREYGMDASKIRYICRLVDKHGLEAIWHKFTKYSPEYKLAAIIRVLENGESVESVAVDLGLASHSILRQWIKSYIENGYNVVTKKKGRSSTRDKEKEDGRRAGEGERRTSRAIVEEDYRERIIKKTSSLSSRGRKEEKEQLTKAVTELRQELRCSLEFILETINSNDSLPHLPRSDYYYWKTRIDPDTKNSDLMDAITTIYTDNHKRYGRSEEHTSELQSQ